MGKLHELIAVENDIKSTTEKILTEATATFSNRKEHFIGSSKTYQPFKDSDNDRPDNEIKHLVTTVREKLDYVFPYIVKQVDYILQKERTNGLAKADLIIEDATGKLITIAESVPVTALVQYEKLFVRIRTMLETSPTLDPTMAWTKDTQKNNVYKTEAFKRVRTKKVQKALILVQATEKFPAQSQMITEDEAVGEWLQTFECGALSPIEKSQLLGKVDMLIEGIKKARAKANQQETEAGALGKTLINFIM